MRLRRPARVPPKGSGKEAFVNTRNEKETTRYHLQFEAGGKIRSGFRRDKREAAEFQWARLHPGLENYLRTMALADGGR